MKRFFIDESKSKVAKSLEIGSRVTLKAEDSRHLLKVLRQKTGAEVEVVWQGKVFLAAICSKTDNQAGLVELEIVSELAEGAESQLKVYLLQGLAKGERMELVIQKSVELGAEAIIPVACSRSVVQLKGDKAQEKQKRWQKIAESAAKQCGREKITEIKSVSNLEQAILSLPADTLLIMPWEEAGDKPNAISLKSVLNQPAPQNVAIIIGPEGGLTVEEVELAKKHQAQIVSLGKRILRTETAAIFVVGVVMYEWGDL